MVELTIYWTKEMTNVATAGAAAAAAEAEAEVQHLCGDADDAKLLQHKVQNVGQIQSPPQTQ